MNVNIDQMDHAFDIIDGFESINNKDFKSPNSIYTQTVLKLNGCDLGVISGQEGFVAAIKQGAQKVYEMIKALIKAIRDFLFGSKKETTVAVKNIERNLKAIDNSYQNFKSEKNELRFQLKTVIDSAVEIEFVANDLIKNTEQNHQNRNETIINAIRLVNSKAIDNNANQHFLNLVSKTGKVIQRLDEKMIFADDIEHLDKICKEIKNVLPELKKIGEQGNIIVSEWTDALNKCNEECKGRGIYDETWGLQVDDKRVIKNGTHHISVIVKSLNVILQSNAKILEQLENQTGKWKKYLED